MAVFTEVSNDEARELLRRLQLGELVSLRGIEGGIENTNYFLTSEQGEFVLTLFERLTAEQLPFYLHLMKHLAHGGIPVPDPQADQNGDILHTVCGKPAAGVDRSLGNVGWVNSTALTNNSLVTSTDAQYLIEYLGEYPNWFNCDKVTTGSGEVQAGCMGHRYRISARYKADGRAQVLLQSIYRRY